MFDRLWELIQWLVEFVVPFVILFPYERGLLIRLGKYKRELGPGFHWVLPCHMDTVLHESVVARTEHLAGLSTTTADGKSVGFDAIVTYRISNLEKALLEVSDLKDAIADTVAGQLGTTLSESNWASIRSGEVVDNLTAVCRKRGWKWGVEIVSVQLAGVALVKNIRLSHGASQPHVMHLSPIGGP
jgi:regulator of protease activity HflC (stomatin/prohibitin superfamily)